MTQASDLPNDQHRSDSIEIMIVRLEGSMERGFDGVRSDVRHIADDLKVVRQRQHDQANDIHSLLVLNIPEKLTDIRTKQAQHDADIDALKSDQDQRKGMVSAIKILWAIVGLLGLEGLVQVARLIGGHP